jgi:hypothetical protein
VITCTCPEWGTAQVDDIKEKAEENKQNNQSGGGTYDGNSSSSGTYSGLNGCLSGCASGCASSCIGWGLDIFAQSVGEYHSQLLDKESKIPRVTSLELFFQTGYNPTGLYQPLPRFRGNWGLFSTDIRYNLLLEPKIGGLERYSTVDWQILVLNLIITPHAHLRVGGGLLFELPTDVTYGDFSLGIDVFIQEKHELALEYRYAPSRTEGSLLYNHLINNGDPLNIYASFGANYTLYYRKISVWTFQGGIKMKLE